MQNRVVFSDNGTLEDISNYLANYRSGSKNIQLVAAQDAIYIGSRLPFNHFYVKLSTANTNASIMTVSYWEGDEWEEAVDIQDETAGFTSSGFVTFTPEPDVGWYRESTNYAGNEIEGLEDVKIYDLYWVKLTFSANFSAGTTIAWIGNLFSNDDDLAAEYPDLSRPNVMDSFEAGKTDWEEQHVKAAGIIIQDLIDANVIVDKGQILNRRDYIDASVMKTAEIIFRAFGDDYRDDMKEARDEYKSRIHKKIHRVDKNKNGQEDVQERFNTVGWLKR
jgi:hypothetical protein